MPSFLSGVRGGIEGKLIVDQRLFFLHRALSGLESRAAIEAEIRKAVVHQGITFVINNACNLACKHCYLQVDKLTGEALSLEESKRLLNSALDRSPDLICLSGKEIFLGSRGSELLSWLCAARDRRGVSTRIGAITNGTLLHLHQDAVLASRLDYLDISVDGVRADHDFNRGPSAYDQMLPNLKWAAEHLHERLFVNMTLQQRNFRSLSQAVAELHDAGVSTVGCSFYHQLPYTDPALELRSEDYDSILTSLQALGTITLKRPLTVLVEVDLLSLPAMLAFLRSDWFVPQDISVDKHGEFYCEHLLPNGLRLQVRFSPFPLLAFKSVRITPEGNYIAAEDTVNTKLYGKHSLGNIRDFDFDLARLQVHASNAPRLKEINDIYFHKTLPQLQAGYRDGLCNSTLVDSESLVAVGV
ncbi:MAG: radical SAM protein [Verrucomicrobia bacterium]|nr:radical SAM protein [Verrucomicrobiota bacterium]